MAKRVTAGTGALQGNIGQKRKFIPVDRDGSAPAKRARQSPQVPAVFKKYNGLVLATLLWVRNRLNALGREPARRTHELFAAMTEGFTNIPKAKTRSLKASEAREAALFRFELAVEVAAKSKANAKVMVKRMKDKEVLESWKDGTNRELLGKITDAFNYLAGLAVAALADGDDREGAAAGAELRFDVGALVDGDDREGAAAGAEPRFDVGALVDGDDREGEEPGLYVGAGPVHTNDPGVVSSLLSCLAARYADNRLLTIVTAAVVVLASAYDFCNPV